MFNFNDKKINSKGDYKKMINKYENIFKLDTKDTSYIIRISHFNHVLNDYYGARISDTLNFDFSKEKYGCMAGTAVNYSEDDVSYVFKNGQRMFY